MARRRRRRGGSHDEGHANHERWLLTYADLITLLLALFVVLYSMSSINISQYNAMMESFGEVLGSTEPPPSDTPEGVSPVSEAPSSPPAEQPTSENAMDSIVEEINAFIEENGYQDKISLIKGDNYILFQFSDSVLFYPDSAKLLPDAYHVLDFVAEILIDYDQYISSIEISGHTADDGEKVNDTFAWQLSADRAIAVLNYLASAGVDESKMYIVANSSYKPIASNETEEGRAQNRRVEIKITNNNE